MARTALRTSVGDLAAVARVSRNVITRIEADLSSLEDDAADFIEAVREAFPDEPDPAARLSPFIHSGDVPNG
jgi:hypothetical protein